MWVRLQKCTPKILYDLLEKDFLPIVCPIGMDDRLTIPTISMRTTQPARLPQAVNAEKLAFLTDIEGVYKDPEDQDHTDLRADM